MEEYYFDVLDDAGRVVDGFPIVCPAVIGRRPPESDTDIQIPSECRSASRQHATIESQGDQLVLADHSRFGTVVNQSLVENRSVALTHGDEIYFGLTGDGWRVRFRVPTDAGGTTTPADPMELLVVSETPRQVRIGRQVVEEQLGDRAFRLFKFLCDHKGNWYTVDSLISLLWPDAETSPLQANEALSRYKKQVNDLISPYLNGQDAIESWPHRGYYMRPRIDDEALN